jgi:hypothetical protein
MFQAYKYVTVTIFNILIVLVLLKVMIPETF